MKIPDKDFITVLIAAIVVAIIFADISAASVTEIMDYFLFGFIWLESVFPFNNFLFTLIFLVF